MAHALKLQLNRDSAALQSLCGHARRRSGPQLVPNLGIGFRVEGLGLRV